MVEWSLYSKGRKRNIEQNKGIVTLDNIFEPITLLFLIGFLFGVASPQLRNRRKMMFCKFTGDGLLGVYLWMMGGQSGACGAFIAATGALIQALTPHKYLKQTRWPRIIAAIILSCASIYFVYQTLLDFLPISAVILCRFGELQSQSQRIRFVYWITSFEWMTYHYINGFYLPLVACIIGSMSILISIIRHHHPNSPAQS